MKAGNENKLRRKMISTKSFSEKMIFSKIFFGVWFARKNYEIQKSEFGKCRRNPATSGRRCRIPARKFDWIRPKWLDSGRNLRNPDHFGQIRPESFGSGWINGQIQSYLTGSWPFWPDPAGSRQFRPDLAGLVGIQQY
jgi:hypothetical protein